MAREYKDTPTMECGLLLMADEEDGGMLAWYSGWGDENASESRSCTY